VFWFLSASCPNKARQSDGFFVTFFAVTLRYHKTIHYKAAAACDVRNIMKSYEDDKKRIATAYEDGLGNEDVEQTNQLFENEPY